MIAPDTDDPQAWLVYADWLQAQPEAHLQALGELIALDHAAPTPERRLRADELTAEHRGTWLGKLAQLDDVKLDDWRGGFPRSLSFRWEGEGAAAASLVVQVIDDLMGARLDKIEVTFADYEGTGSVAPIVQALAERRRPASLRELVLQEPANLGSPWQTEPPHVGDLGGLWRPFALERLIVDGHTITLGEVYAPRLRELALRFVGAQALRQLGAAELPLVTDLRLCVDAPGDAASLLPLLDGSGLPALRRLALGTAHGRVNGEILELLPRLGALARVEALDLAWMRIQDDDVAILSRHRAALAHIPWVRVNVRSLSQQGRDAVPRLGRELEVVRFRYI